MGKRTKFTTNIRTIIVAKIGNSVEHKKSNFETNVSPVAALVGLVFDNGTSWY